MNRGVSSLRSMVVATLAAVAVQPLLFAIWFLVPLIGEDIFSRELLQLLQLSLFVVAVAATFVIVLGVPVFLLLRHLDRAQPRAVGTVGFLIAATPIAIWIWPLRLSSSGSSYSGTWHGSYVQFQVDGSVTLYGWLSYLEAVLVGGAHGLVGALVFLAVWRRMHGPERPLE